MEIKLASISFYLLQSFWVIALFYQSSNIAITDVSERQKNLTIFFFIVAVGFMNFFKNWAIRDKAIVEKKLIEEDLELKKLEKLKINKELELLEKFEKHLDKFRDENIV